MAELGTVKNIFLIYPPFSGGKHITNLIRLCSGVEPNLLLGEELLTLYTQHNIRACTGINSDGLVAHYNTEETDTINIDRLYNCKDQLIKQQHDGYINLIHGHHNDFKKLLSNYQCIEGLEDIKWLMIENPAEGSLFWKIMQIENAGRELIKNEPALYVKLDQIYTWDYSPLKVYDTDRTIISKITNIYDICPSHNGISIDPSQYCSYDGFKYLRDTLKGYFGLELPPIADRIHKLWIDMIEYRVLHSTFKRKCNG